MQILHHYYPRDLQIQYTNRFFTNVSGSYPNAFPGTALREGSSGENVRIMQMYLNRISGNWFIPPIPNPNGFFGPETARTVTEFQRIFRLTPDGVIGRATWYEIIRVFVAAKSLAELTSEGDRIGIQNPPPTTIVRMGDRGENVVKLQYVLAYLGEFYPDLPLVVRSGVFRENTRDAVIAFQRHFRLNPDGIVGPVTWRKLWEVYFAAKGTVPPTVPESPAQPNIPGYPGTLIRQGSRGPDVLLMQNYLNAIRRVVPSIPALNPDGVFGPITHSAVAAFQRHFGLNPDGIIGPITWYRIVEEFNSLQSTPGPGPGPSPTPNPPYPGTLIRVGSRGADVSLVQTRLNTVSRAFPAIPTLVADGTFGPLTEGAVTAFQRVFGLNADGIVGPITWERLMNVSSNLPNVSNPEYPGVLMSVGSRGPSVTVMQNYLNTIRSRFPSITQLAADGSFGPITQGAVTAFQNLMGISANGIIGPITWNYIVSVHNAVNMNTRASSISTKSTETPNNMSGLGLMLAMSMFKGRRLF
ncbi:MAG: peptidoglycan-binding protein [Defluviitaleaceae bacterium]|nr:peptidoglycan-binding protein [Defluviitaleaceae bacterium]